LKKAIIYKQLEMVFIPISIYFGQASSIETTEDVQYLIVGPKVVSRHITLPHILSVNNILKRRVTIWDNLNANDYDVRRLCLGPFSGHSTALSPHLNGMLTNPNCEFELNFIPYHTLAQWFHSFETNHSNEAQYSNEQQCTLLIRSPIGIQCQYLLIQVKKTKQYR
jgi:hypothetical protein